MTYELSDTLINAVKGFEGFRSAAYRDSGGVLTIGYGHTRGVKSTDKITQQQGEEYLRQDLDEALTQVRLLSVCTTQGQADALTDFVYNLGIAKLKSSTLLRYITLGKPVADIQKEFRRWVYCKGKRLQGLVTRREWEAKRWAE